MSFHVSPFYGIHGKAEVWELMPSRTMAMLVAEFTNHADAELFASLKNGLRQSAQGQTVDLGSFAKYAEEDKNFVFADCTFVDDIPEASPEDVVLMDDDAELVAHPPKEDEEKYGLLGVLDGERIVNYPPEFWIPVDGQNEDWFYSTLNLLQMDDEQLEAYLNGADIDEVMSFRNNDPHYCEAGTPIGTPTCPEDGDFL